MAREPGELKRSTRIVRVNGESYTITVTDLNSGKGMVRNPTPFKAEVEGTTIVRYGVSFEGASREAVEAIKEWLKTNGPREAPEHD